MYITYPVKIKDIPLYYFEGLDLEKLMDEFYAYVNDGNFKTAIPRKLLRHKLCGMIHVIIREYYHGENGIINLNIHLLDDIFPICVNPIMHVLEANCVIKRYSTPYQNIELCDEYKTRIKTDPYTPKVKTLWYITKYEKKRNCPQCDKKLREINAQNVRAYRKRQKLIRIEKKKEQARIDRKIEHHRQALERRAAKKLAIKEAKIEAKKRLIPKYWVVISRNNKICDKFGLFVNYEDAMVKYNEIIESSNKVIFPKRIIHKSINRERKIFVESDYELLLLKKTEENDEVKEVFYPNNTGKMIQNIVKDNKWYVYDKTNIEMEESFMIFGVSDPSRCATKKNYTYIIDEIILRNESNSLLRQVIVYKNNLMILHDDDDFDLIITKNFSESVRLYTKLQEDCAKMKLNTIFFSTITKAFSQEIRDILMKKTNWNICRAAKGTLRYNHLK